MFELLFSNIKKSFEFIQENKPKVEEDLIEIIINSKNNKPREKSDLLYPLARSALSLHPWFYVKNRTIYSPQQNFFGFYAFRNILRGILLGFNFFNSGFLLKNQELDSPAISMLYTASFHFLYSFLALEGRVIEDNARGPIVITYNDDSSSSGHKELDIKGDTIIAILTRNNSWKFEGRTRSHKTKWRELSHIFNHNNFIIPEYFERFLSYLNSYGPYEKISRDDNNYYNFTLDELTQTRHTAIYDGFGLDDFVIDGLLNHELIFGQGKDKKLDEFYRFTKSFAKDILVHATNLIEKVDIGQEVKKFLIASIYIPPFDICNFSVTKDSEINDKVSKIFEWLIMGLIK